MNCEQKDLHVLQWDEASSDLSVMTVAQMLTINQNAMLHVTGTFAIPIMLGTQDACERMRISRERNRAASAG